MSSNDERKPMKHETTSKRVSRTAARLLRQSAKSEHKFLYLGTLDITEGFVKFDINHFCSVDDFQSIAGSALTQSAPKSPERKGRK